MKTRVGITMRVVEAVGYTEPRDAISHDWMRFVTAFGLRPVLIPNTVDPRWCVDEFELQLLLLTNGNDVVAGEPGAVKGSDVSPERNRAEASLLDLAIERRLPVLGACRGLQMINTYFGGTVMTNLESVSGSADAHVGRPHPITITDASAAAGLSATRTTVNSFHRQAVTTGTLASPLRSFATADDGVIEGLYHPTLPIRAVQWHPERPGAPTAIDVALMESWVGDCL